jgi:hypothetical protein
MESTMVRVRGKTRDLLRQLAKKTNSSMQDVVDKAAEALRKQLLWADVNAAFAAMRNDPEVWAHELEERRLWDQTLADGLDPEEWQNKDRPARRKRRAKRA